MTAPAISPIESRDGSLRQILAYSLGSIEGGLSGQFFNLINSILLVALGMNPMVAGLILTVNILIAGILDPLMAHWSDNIRTRWGRRRPFILIGSIARVLVITFIVALFPNDSSIASNAKMAEERAAVPRAPAPAGKPVSPSGLWEKLATGLAAFTTLDNPYHHRVAMFLLVSGILFSIAGTMTSVSYYALGIELCPSYDGRTRVVTYRSILDKFVGLLNQWALPFCFLPIFQNVLGGLFSYGLIIAAVSLPATLYMVWQTREPLTPARATNVSHSNAIGFRRPGLFRSMWLTAKNVHFLKILFLYQCISFTLGIFAQVGLLLTIFWVFDGDALRGSTINSYAGTIGLVVAFLALPAVNWACRRLQKHRALRFAIVWMSLGTALKWVLVTPEHPYWQLVLPFFFSLGISAVFTILPTMMADVTDVDELQNGRRREAMFGAVMGFLMKLTGAVQPLLAGFVLVLAGYDAALGTHQSPATIFNMRVLFSLVPAALLLLALLALWRYPLTRERMTEIQAELARRHGTIS